MSSSRRILPVVEMSCQCRIRLSLSICCVVNPATIHGFRSLSTPGVICQVRKATVRPLGKTTCGQMTLNFKAALSLPEGILDEPHWKYNSAQRQNEVTLEFPQGPRVQWSCTVQTMIPRDLDMWCTHFFRISLQHLQSIRRGRPSSMFWAIISNVMNYQFKASTSL